MIEILERIKSEPRFEVFFQGGCSEDVLEEAQRYFGLRFTEDYQDFLLNYGICFIEGLEVMGISNMDFSTKVISDAASYTNWWRRKDYFPKELFILRNEDGDELHCLFLSANNKLHGNVVVWDVYHRRIDRILGETFTDYLEVEFSYMFELDYIPSNEEYPL